MLLHKFHGAGNDFIIVDDYDDDVKLTRKQIAHLCDRHYGIGADGLMLLLPPDPKEQLEAFTMRYYNNDGNEATMCGNGARCIAMLYYLLCLENYGKSPNYICFSAKDGGHTAEIKRWNAKTQQGLVTVRMQRILPEAVSQVLDGHLIDTGVPHYVQEVTDLEHFDVVGEGRRLRHHPALGKEGANIDFVERDEKGVLHIRTYERGIEDETLACGTGITAAAVITGAEKILARGGTFAVKIDRPTPRWPYYEPYLTGPVARVFTTELEVY